jgi:hypothetical protein
LVAKLFEACVFKKFEYCGFMAPTILSTTSAVMDALGGNGPVSLLTGSKPSAVSNWRSFDNFPANTYFAMTSALRAKGMSAPPSLWGMKTPAESEGASA